MSSRIVVHQYGYTPGPWKWDSYNGHILNSRYNTQDGSAMDFDSIIIMLNHKQRYHLCDGDAELISRAPEMYETLNSVLSEIQAMPYDRDGVVENIENMLIECLAPIDEEIAKNKVIK